MMSAPLYKCPFAKRFLYSSIAAGIALFACFSLHADQDSDNNVNGGLQVSVQLNHRVNIPQILFFRIGSIGSVDAVMFDLGVNPQPVGDNQSYSSPASRQIGDGNVVSATSNGNLTVYLAANVTPVEISYTVSDANGLGDGAGNYIPFEDILTSSSNPALPSPVLSNAGGAPGSANAVTVNGNNFGGLVADYIVQWTYQYRNINAPLAGTYSGRVTYTASTP